MPVHAPYLETFATHNSDLGQNGHRFRREESVAIAPVLAALLKGYQEKGEIDEAAYRQVSEECRKIVVAADRLLASGNENRSLINEMRPWLTQFKQVGEYGEEVLGMMRLQKQKAEFEECYEHTRALQVLMSETDAFYRAGVKSGSRHLMPTFNALFEAAVTHYNKLHRADLNVQAVYLPYALESDVKQLASLPVQQKGKTGSITPSNEVINWQAGGAVTLTMDYPRQLTSLVIDLGSAEAANSLIRLEVSADGKDWQPVEMKPGGYRTQLKASVEGLNILKIRLVNVSDVEQKVYFKRFRFTEK